MKSIHELFPDETRRNIHRKLDEMRNAGEVVRNLFVDAIASEMLPLLKNAHREGKQWSENKLRFHIEGLASYIVRHHALSWSAIMLNGICLEAWKNIEVRNLEWDAREKMATAILVEDVMLKLDRYNAPYTSCHEEYSS